MQSFAESCVQHIACAHSLMHQWFQSRTGCPLLQGKLKACTAAARFAHLIRKNKGIDFLLGQVVQVAQHALHCYRPAMQTALKHHCALTAIS